MINVKLFNKVMNFVYAEAERASDAPVRWNQEVWGTAEPDAVNVNEIVERSSDDYGGYDSYYPVSCGTAFCFAGWAAKVEGSKLLIPTWQYSGDYSILDIEHVQDKDGNIHNIKNFAMKALGISSVDAGTLFDASNDLEDIETEVMWIALEAGYLPSQLGVRNA